MHNQLTFSIKGETSYSSSDFIISSCNQEAFNHIVSWPNNWGINPYERTLLLHAPKLAGKTHLAKIWQLRSSAIFCVESDNFLQILPNQNFVIESPENWNEEKLLHYFNIIQENGGYLLLTSTINHLNFKLKDLSSRINSLLKISINPIDDDLVQTLLTKYFSMQSVNVSPKVIQFLLHQLPRNFDAIKRAAEQINQYALTHKRSVTIPMLKSMGVVA